ncbi:MAG: 2-C-methyl-D-erythritol 4-phosphate cytidylyltransferase [Bacillota bacterium]|jgi:2-C-methyl-D-erythritol 4-phosphate cytidylyltransferase
MYYVSAVIAAGGSGSRMGMPVNKVYVPLNGLPLLCHTLLVFSNCPLINEIVVVVPQNEIDFCRKTIIEPLGFCKAVKITAGGKERQDSVRCGLRETSSNCDYVVVHDGARPLLTPAVLEAVLQEGFSWGAAVAAVPVKDTIKIADSQGFVIDTPERDKLWSVQTPQVFSKDILTAAHELAERRGVLGTDDAFLVEQMGHRVKIVPGEYENIKVTTPEDLDFAEAVLGRRRG